jgi:hypothetical protein
VKNLRDAQVRAMVAVLLAAPVVLVVLRWLYLHPEINRA